MIYLYFLILILLGVFFFDIKKGLKNKNLFYALLLIYASLLSGLSYRLGGDTIVYMEQYQYYSSNIRDLFNYEYLMSFYGYMPGWVFCCTLFKILQLDFWVFYLVHSIFINYVFFLTIKRYSPLIFTALLAYVLILYVTLNFEVLRESIAVCFFLLGIPALLKRRLINYYAYIFVALLFHNSAFFLIAIPLFLVIPLNKKTLTVFVFITSIVLLSMTFFSELLSTSIPSIPFFEEKTRSYFSHERYGGSVFNASFSINLLFNTIFPLVVLVKLHSSSKIPLFLKLSIAYSFIYLLTLVISIFYRLNNYLTIFFICLLTYLPTYFRLYFTRKTSIMVSIALLSVYFVFKILALTYPLGDSNFLTYCVFYPYSSVFDKSLDATRENFYVSY